jgi:uncharacterized phage protein (TIGR02220 family)
VDTGYIRLNRQFLDSDLWNEKRVFSKAEAWIDILFEVRCKSDPEKWGQSLISISSWSARWGWSRSKVSRFFDYLKREKMISVQTNNKSTQLTVLNYEVYDTPRTSNEHQGEIKRKSTNSKPEQLNTLTNESYNTPRTSNEHQANSKPEQLRLLSQKVYDTPRTSNEHQGETERERRERKERKEPKERKEREEREKKERKKKSDYAGSVLPLENFGDVDISHSLNDRCKEILDFLNESTGMRFKHNGTSYYYIRQRLLEFPKVSIDDIKFMIAAKVVEWTDDDALSPYLRPRTLFSPVKFEEYLQHGYKYRRRMEEKQAKKVSYEDPIF